MAEDGVPERALHEIWALDASPMVKWAITLQGRRGTDLDIVAIRLGNMMCYSVQTRTLGYSRQQARRNLILCKK
jgi:hypothetical protein